MSGPSTATSPAAGRTSNCETPWAAIDGVCEGKDAIRRFFSDLSDTGPAFLRVTVSGRASGIPRPHRFPDCEYLRLRRRQDQPHRNLPRPARGPRSRGVHMKGWLSRGSVDPARCWVEGRGMVARATPGAPRLKCRLDRPVWSGSYARAGYLKTLVRRRACILESGAARLSLKAVAHSPYSRARRWRRD